MYLRQNLGVGALRIKYGGRNKRKGTVPEHFAKASGGLIRHILKQLGAPGWACSGCVLKMLMRGVLQWPGQAPVQAAQCKVPPVAAVSHACNYVSWHLKCVPNQGQYQAAHVCLGTLRQPTHCLAAAAGRQH